MIYAALFLFAVILFLVIVPSDKSVNVPVKKTEPMPSDDWVLTHTPNQGRFRKKKNDLVINRHFQIEYIDKEGNQTKRNIFVHFVSEDHFGNKNLLAFCYLRNEHREFFIHKILSLIDLKSGEVIQDKIEYLNSIKIA